MAAGAEMEANTIKGNTPLMIAAQNGRTDCGKALLAAGANANAANSLGFTALHGAAQDGHAICLQSLLAYGCNFDAVTKQGVSALMAATKNKQHECVKLLLKAGANARLVASSAKGGNVTARDVAIGIGADAKTVKLVTRVCVVCGKAPPKLGGKFPKCCKVYYCGKVGQTAHWPTHKADCERVVMPKKSADDGSTDKDRK
jgi:hypothetical protein